MERRAEGLARIPRGIWTVVLLVVVGLFFFATTAAYRGTFRSYIPVTLTSDRSGLVMEIDAKVKLRGVDVGRVGDITTRDGHTALKLEIDPDQIPYLPANVSAKISTTTAFGAKFVDLTMPDKPTARRLAAGAVLHSGNVTTEVNTVFENVVDLLKLIDPAKLNAVISAVAEGVRGQGEQIGQATTDLNQVLLALNARKATITADLRSAKTFGDTYDAAANDIVTILRAASTTSDTVVNHAKSVDALLINTIGVSAAGVNLLGRSKDNLIAGINTLESTTDLLFQYNPEYTCTLQGTKLYLDKAAPSAFAPDGRSLVLDVAMMLGNDPYVFPENLPITAAKGGPGGKPGCGSLPDPRKNFPIRQLITNTGWGTGVDMRPNPGIGSPCYASFFWTTHGYPGPATYRRCVPGAAPGPEPYLGAPPYGAHLYGPGGVPLFPGVPPAQPGPPASPPPP